MHVYLLKSGAEAPTVLDGDLKQRDDEPSGDATVSYQKRCGQAQNCDNDSSCHDQFGA